MEETVLPPSSIGRVNLSDLIAVEGLASDAYRLSVSTLTQSLAQYSAAIVKLPRGDAAWVRSCLDSARLYFHQLGYNRHEESNNPPNNSTDWSRTSGYYSNPQLSLEIFDYRPGLTLIGTPGTPQLSPCSLPEVFSILAKASKNILEAISFSLNLQTSSFSAILDNTPLRNNEISSSVLSICRHSQNPKPYDYEQQVDKTLITIVKPDKPGFNVKDVNGFWVLVDQNLDPNEFVVYAGLALYQVTGGSVGPALHRTAEVAPPGGNLFGRCSVSFKLMPKTMECLNSTVDDFIHQRNFKNNNGPDVPFKNSTNKKKDTDTSSSIKPLPPSKRLRQEAQRVLKDKVQQIAEERGVKLKFCSIKQCEGHLRESDSSCIGIRARLGWPPGVPFVHPHDLPNKAKIEFLEAFEPGWIENNNNNNNKLD